MTEQSARAFAQQWADREGKPWNVYRMKASPHVYVPRGPFERTPSPERYELAYLVHPTPGSTPHVSHGFTCDCCPRMRR